MSAAMNVGKARRTASGETPSSSWSRQTYADGLVSAAGELTAAHELEEGTIVLPAPGMAPGYHLWWRTCMVMP